MFRTLLLLVVAALLLSAAAVDQPVRPTPMVRTVQPSPAKAGDLLVASGQYLGKENVAEVYLTSGDNIFKAEIKSQSDASIAVTVPTGLKPGKFGFMVLVKADIPRYIDEPVFVMIE